MKNGGITVRLKRIRVRLKPDSTYFELHREVVKLSAALTDMGVTAGDRVAIYMGMLPETAVAMLACARIGAVHSVVFGGFSAQSVADRIQDSQAKLVITADGGFRRGGAVHSIKS